MLTWLHSCSLLAQFPLLPGLGVHSDMKEHLLSWTTCWWVSSCVFPSLIGWSPTSLDWLKSICLTHNDRSRAEMLCEINNIMSCLWKWNKVYTKLRVGKAKIIWLLKFQGERCVFFFLKNLLGHCEIIELMETVLIKWVVASHSNKRIYGRPQQFSTYQLKIHSEANHTAAWKLYREYRINQVLWIRKRCKKKKKRNQMKREKGKHVCSLNCL